MDGFDGQDLVSSLQSQLSDLRRRVEELERENGRLSSDQAKCKCPKDKAKVNGNKNYKANVDQESQEAPGRKLRIIESCASRYVALKIMYFGQRFYGFASEAQMDPTVESEVFRALQRTKLLVSKREDARYSRCGRTDKGVSATGQVIALYLRSNLKDNGGKDLLGGNCEEEIDYVKVLNRVLPKDIRVTGWSPISGDFHARFSCLSRTYRYLFWRTNRDILAMQEAAEKFIGEHDFRNFCKMDASNVHSYIRKITCFDISLCNRSYGDDELWAVTIKGTAFLWHQVRCIVSVLFMIGEGLESPDVVDELLDIKKAPRKPQYNMAPELPLIFQSCEFDDLEFCCSSDSKRGLHEHLKNEYQTFILQATIFEEALNCLPEQEDSTEHAAKKKSHISLMLRPTEPSYIERRAKLNIKASRKNN